MIEIDAISPAERRCQKCGIPTGGEEAYVDGQIWCHPCADTVSPPSTNRCRYPNCDLVNCGDCDRRPTDEATGGGFCANG